jgi:hypothetical protein
MNRLDRRAKEALSLEDAQEIIENVTGFIKLLMRWDMQQKLSEEKLLDSLPSTMDNR